MAGDDQPGGCQPSAACHPVKSPAPTFQSTTGIHLRGYQVTLGLYSTRSGARVGANTTDPEVIDRTSVLVGVDHSFVHSNLLRVTFVAAPLRVPPHLSLNFYSRQTRSRSRLGSVMCEENSP